MKQTLRNHMLVVSSGLISVVMVGSYSSAVLRDVKIYAEEGIGIGVHTDGVDGHTVGDSSDCQWSAWFEFY